MTETSFLLEASDGQPVHVLRWDPQSGDPRGVVQVAHGAAEHAARYRRFAVALNEAGYAVYANDHRGHGVTGADHGTLGVARPGGWEATVRDAHELTERIRADRPSTPIVLFGHSMGTMVAQCYVQRWGDGLAGVVLSGPTGRSALGDDLVALLQASAEGQLSEQPSELWAGTFAGFNAAYGGGAATGYEWLSRDVDEVRAYADDPWCGIDFTNGYVADMLGALARIAEDDEGIPRDLPILVIAGSDDPVGGEDQEGTKALVAHLETLGIGPITARYYEGARHELLNETNRDEVTADVIGWLGRTVSG